MSCLYFTLFFFLNANFLLYDSVGRTLKIPHLVDTAPLPLILNEFLVNPRPSALNPNPPDGRPLRLCPGL